MNDHSKPSEQELENWIVYNKKKNLLQGLKDLENSLPEIEAAPTSWYRKKWPWLVLTLISLAVLVLLLFKTRIDPKPKSNTNAIIAAYFQHTPSLSTQRTTSDEKSLEERAFEAYEATAYAEAVPLLTDLFLVEKDSTTLFWLGVAQLGNGQAKEAIQTFNSFQQFQAKLLSQRVHFYLMLAYLQESNTAKVKEHAQAITQEELKPIAEEVLNNLTGI